MKIKSRNLSKTIGIVRRGGMYSPSNELSEAKISLVLTGRKAVPAQVHNFLFDDLQFLLLKEIARAHGYKVLVIERGLNR